MVKLIYAAISSLDGYVADAEGTFDWSMRTTRCTRSSTILSGRSNPPVRPSDV